jgi:hypothetical protein
LPPLALLSADVALTLQGQPAAYWAGEPACAREGNPLARWFLLHGPAAFVAAAVCWGAAISAALLAWRHPLAPFLALAVTVGHAAGAASWLPRFGWPGLLGVAAVVLAADRLWGLAWRRAAVGGLPWQRGTPKPARPPAC